MNIGNSTRLPYDTCAYKDRLTESTDPLLYRVYPPYNTNCDGCLSTLGPRSGFQGNGVSTVVGQSVATSQQLVDVESILSNRNMVASKCRSGEVNPVDVNQLKLKNLKICNNYLNPESSRLSYPAYNYREIATNRFIDLPKQAQKVIFWDFAANTRLEATDNFTPEVPYVSNVDLTLPQELKGKPKPCNKKIECTAFCPKTMTKKSSRQ